MENEKPGFSVHVPLDTKCMSLPHVPLPGVFLSQVCIQVNVCLGGELGLQRGLLGLFSHYWQKVCL